MKSPGFRGRIGDGDRGGSHAGLAACYGGGPGGGRRRRRRLCLGRGGVPALRPARPHRPCQRLSAPGRVRRPGSRPVDRGGGRDAAGGVASAGSGAAAAAGAVADRPADRPGPVAARAGPGAAGRQVEGRGDLTLRPLDRRSVLQWAAAGDRCRHRRDPGEPAPRRHGSGLRVGRHPRARSRSDLLGRPGAGDGRLGRR